MSSGYERPDSGDGGTACAYTGYGTADGIECGEKEWAASPGDGLLARGEGTA